MVYLKRPKCMYNGDLGHVGLRELNKLRNLDHPKIIVSQRLSLTE